MKKYYRSIAGLTAVLLVCLSFSGCGSRKKEILELTVSDSEKEFRPESEDTGVSGLNSPDTETDSPAAGKEETEDAASDRLIYVYLCGAVRKPGVYEVPEGTRLFRLLQLAEGMTEEAAPEALNQAEILSDGARIQVPTITEWQEAAGTDPAGTGAAGSAGTGNAGGSLVNINTADESELMTLNGIGASRAADIISWREEHGGFTSIEEIKKVNGIKDGLFRKIRDQIRI